MNGEAIYNTVPWRVQVSYSEHTSFTVFVILLFNIVFFQNDTLAGTAWYTSKATEEVHVVIS